MCIIFQFFINFFFPWDSSDIAGIDALQEDLLGEGVVSEEVGGLLMRQEIGGEIHIFDLIWKANKNN